MRFLVNYWLTPRMRVLIDSLWYDWVLKQLKLLKHYFCQSSKQTLTKSLTLYLLLYQGILMVIQSYKKTLLCLLLNLHLMLKLLSVDPKSEINNFDFEEYFIPNKIAILKHFKIFYKLLVNRKIFFDIVSGKII